VDAKREILEVGCSSTEYISQVGRMTGTTSLKTESQQDGNQAFDICSSKGPIKNPATEQLC
jgi:hypothetical protein